MLRDNLDILVAVTTLEFVLDANVGEVHVVVEVREVVFEGPAFDLARVPIRSPVAVRAVPIVFLEKALVAPLEVVLEDYATDVCPLLTEACLCT